VDTQKESPAMAKRSVGRPRTDADNVTVKIDRSLTMKAKLIASHRGVSAADLLNELLQVPVDRAYAQMLRELDSSGK
jgi:reverse gyrase